MVQKPVFVIGAVASGKSWYLEREFAQRDFEVLNVYDHQQKAYRDAGLGKLAPMKAQFRCLLQANMQLLDDILEMLAAGKNVAVEQTFFKAKRRITYIDAVRKQVPDATIEVYVMNPSDALWQSNLEKRKLPGSLQRYKEERSQLEFPNPAEGFDAIYEVVDGVARLRMEPPRYEVLAQARKELAEEEEELRREDEVKREKQALLESMEKRRFWHYCEVCGAKEFLSAQEAFDSGWDYPPRIGRFGVLGPRTCGSCLINGTLFWKISTSGKLPIVCEGDLTPEELVTWRRIKGEPESLLEAEG